MTLAARYIAPEHDASPLGAWYRLALTEAEGDQWRGLRAAVAKLLIVSGEPPRRWRHVAHALVPTLTEALAIYGGLTPRKALSRATVLALAGELEALAVWDEVCR